MSEFGKRLTNLRESKGWSKTYVAKAIGLSSMQTYANYEYGRREPDFNTVDKLANLFNVSTDYLLGRTDTPQFTRRDERDVQKILTDMTEGLSNDSSLAYMKNGGEEIDEEDAELLRASLENVIRQSKLIAKAKFTPKKYRKDNK